MQRLFFVMEVNQSLSDFFHEFSALIWFEFANEVGKASIGAVLEHNDQELFLFVKEELSGLEDVWMIERDVHLSFFFGISFVFLGDRDDFERVLVFVNGFNKVNFAETPFPQEFEENVVIHFLKHSFWRLDSWIKIMRLFYLIKEQIHNG
jgi:hypothetical protein